MQERLFKTWLEQHFKTKGSISSCISRCRRIENELAVNLDKEFDDDRLESVEEFLSDQNSTIAESINGDRKTGLSSLKSSVRKYREFRSDRTKIAPEEITEEKTVPLCRHIHSESFFPATEISQEALRRIFLFRLKTQSRSYISNGINLIFPIRTVSKIFSRSGDSSRLTSLLNEKISSVKFLRADGSGLPLAKLDKISFRASKVLVYPQIGEPFPLYERTENGNLPVHESTIKNLSLDHRKPLEKILRENKADLHALQTMTLLCIQLVGNDDSRLLRENDWNNLLLEKYPKLLEPQFRNSLLRDLELILNATDLEIMSRSRNSSKSNRI